MPRSTTWVLHVDSKLSLVVSRKVLSFISYLEVVRTFFSFLNRLSRGIQMKFAPPRMSKEICFAEYFYVIIWKFKRCIRLGMGLYTKSSFLSYNFNIWSKNMIWLGLIENVSERFSLQLGPLYLEVRGTAKKHCTCNCIGCYWVCAILIGISLG